MLIPRPVLDGIVDGRITLLFRKWDRPRAVAGAKHRTPVGLISIDTVDAVPLSAVTAADAKAAGTTRTDLLAYLRSRPGRNYRMAVSWAGEDPRIGLRADAVLGADELAALAARLERLDRASRTGPWTADVLRLVAANEERRAPDLAAWRGEETQPFKTNVRKLKNLGLTESLEVGYRVSPRGRTYLQYLNATPGPTVPPGRLR